MYIHWQDAEHKGDNPKYNCGGITFGIKTQQKNTVSRYDNALGTLKSNRTDFKMKKKIFYPCLYAITYMNIIYSDTHAELSMTKAVQMSSVQCTHLYIPSMYTQYFDMNSFTPPLSLSLSFFQTINHYYIIVVNAITRPNTLLVVILHIPLNMLYRISM